MRMEPAWRIRRMAAADVERVVEIAATVKSAPQWPRAAYQTAVDPAAAPGRVALVVAEADSGSVAGFLVAVVLPPQAELESIAVASERQRLGLGRCLFDALAGKLHAAQVTEVALEVRASNRPALELYRSLGFVEAGRRARYYTDPVEDAVLMTLRLR